MLLIDAKTGGIFKANHSVAKYYGNQENELVGMMYEQLNVLSEEELKMIIQQISMNITHDFTCKQRTAEGRVREVEVHANIVKMDDRELIFAITNDITDKKRTEVELIKAKNTAEEAVKIKSEFLANISHEIRTPMNSILGFAELLKQTKLTETQNDYIETLSKSGELLLDTINDVLNFSKLEAGQIFLEEIPFNLEFLLEDVFRVIRAKLVSLPVDNYIDISANVPLNLIGDPTRLRQILMNLLNNSVKFTASGSIGVTVELDDETKDEDNPVLKFCVRDTGVGIPKEKQRLIFEAFTQSESSAVRNYGGAGLGLAICKKIIVALNGSIWVESEFGRGSDFIFKIPFKRGKSAIEQPVYPLSDKALSEVSAGIIDDNPVSQMIHKKYCEDLGIKIAFVSSSAAEALEQMEQIFNKGIIPDILLCDIVMDQMDGYEFGAILRKDDRFKAVKIIAISVDKQVGMARKSQEIGFNGFLSKPISRQHLRSLICTILGDQRESPAIVTKHMAEEMRLKGVRILVAEDNNTNKDLLKAYFNTLGCYGDYTKNGKEFVERFNDAKYDLCIVDVFMPEMGGIEAARIIRTELKSNIPILAITASTNQSDLDKCLSIGINDFLIKPLDLLSLKKKIIQFTGR
jgi:PAS domain S-box-containing protein